MTSYQHAQGYYGAPSSYPARPPFVPPLAPAYGAPAQFHYPPPLPPPPMPMPMLQPQRQQHLFFRDPEHFRSEYMNRLSHLTQNSRPQIQDLSMLAHDHPHFCDIVVDCIATHIRRVSRLFHFLSRSASAVAPDALAWRGVTARFDDGLVLRSRCILSYYCTVFIKDSISSSVRLLRAAALDVAMTPASLLFSANRGLPS